MITLLVGAALAGTVTDNRGETITADSPQRIVSLGGGVTELVYALGAGDRVVAVDASSGYPEAVESVTKLGYHRQVGAEGILSLSPDLVIATTDAGPPASMEQIEAAGVSLLVLDASPGIDALKGRIQVLSALLDVSDKGAELQAGIDTSLGQVAADGAAPRVMFIYARGGGTLNVSGTNTAAAEMILLAGGVNAVDGYEGYRPLTAESAVMAAPDVLLLTEGGLGSLGGAEGLLKQPGIGLTPAGQNQRIVVMDDLYLLGFGPRAGAAAQELSVQFRAPQ